MRRTLVIAPLVLAAPLCAGQVVSALAPNVFRFDLDQQARENALPSMSFEDPGRREISLRMVPMPEIKPQLSMQDGMFTVHIPHEEGTSYYGTGEVPGRLLRNGRTNVNWNTDAYGYSLEFPSLYKAHPWVLAVRADGSSFGVLVDTTWRSTFDLNDGIKVMAEGPACPVIIFEGGHPADVVKQLSDYVGRIQMPPKWAIGYHQCRYSYYPESRVREVVEEFRERDIPADVIWMDIDYMDGFRIFTFNDEYFPDPKGLNQWLDEQGFANVWMINPGVKHEEGFFIYDEGEARDVWVKTADKLTDYRGEVWPGWCKFPDYTNAEVREWWAGLYEPYMALEIDGVWNDMNEPAIFNVQSKTMPEDNWHRADEELGGPGPHARFHNVYGMMMIRATHQGVTAANPDKRPFVLSRANYIGGHRYGATWSGDNNATWEHMEWSVPMTLNMSLSAAPFNGPDIGGFNGNGTPELFQRWIGFGAMLPFSRGHTGKGNIDKEPWAFGPEVEATARRALQRRYVIMPHLYTAFREAATTGMPITRPLFFIDPADMALRSEDDAFLLGDGLLVKCHMVPDRSRAVAMPEGIWRRFDFRDLIDGDESDLELPELYLQGGQILPTGPVKEFVNEKPLDTVTLYVSVDEAGRATGTLYEDAGEGWDFMQGDYRLTRFDAEMTFDGKLVVTSAVESGNRASEIRTVRVIWLTEDGWYEASAPKGQRVVVDPASAGRIDG